MVSGEQGNSSFLVTEAFKNSIWPDRKTNLTTVFPVIFQPPARVSLNGSISTSNFTVVFFGRVSFRDVFACLQLRATAAAQPRLEMDFQHSLPLLQSLGIARENQVEVSAVRSDKYKGTLGIVLGPCSLRADGEVSLASNETDTEWVLTFRNKCVGLQVRLDCSLCGVSLCISDHCESRRTISRCNYLWKGWFWSLRLFWQSSESGHLQKECI